MKTTHLTRSIVAAVLLGGSATMLLAQDAANLPCPVGHAPGYGRKLTPEQRAGHRAAMQQQMTVLREKQANGTLTAEEQTWLKQAEERGGPCVTGTPVVRAPARACEQVKVPAKAPAPARAEAAAMVVASVTAPARATATGPAFPSRPPANRGPVSGSAAPGELRVLALTAAATG
jgi:hypothetical protein